MENKQSSNKTITIVLAVLLIALAGYTFYAGGQHKEIQKELTTEKESIQKELADMVAKYDAAIAENTSMTTELTTAKNEIIALSDSIEKTNKINYRKIRRYRNRVADLEATNKKLFHAVDSLTKLSNELTVDLNSAKETIEEQTELNTKLNSENAALTEKVILGSVLNASNVQAIAMKNTSADKMKKTTRFRRTDAFRVSFTVAKNAIAEAGEREAYFVVKDAAGNTVESKGTFGEGMSYTGKMMVNYENQDLDVINLINVDRKNMSKGVYTIEVFFEGKSVGVAEVDLKSNVLGIF